ncbi:MAG TPA: hypothetical protein VFZ97_06825 [Acidimicrobiales bacterium]
MTGQPQEADDLFGLRPEEFTAARNALAKRLKSEGLTEQAAGVQALKRPSPTAWAVNQVARERPALIDALIDAGERLRAAIETTMGGDRSGLPAAQAQERRAIEDVVGAAVALLEAGGNPVPESARHRMSETLRAATVDSSVAERLRKGNLQTDMAAPGFGLEAIPAGAFSRSRVSRDEDDSRNDDREIRLGQLRREVDQAEQRLQVARAAARDAEETAARLRSDVKEAEKRLRAAQKSLDDETKASG